MIMQQYVVSRASISVITARLEFGDRQPANAGQKYLLTCHPASGRQETAGQPISRQSSKLQLILVHIYRLRVNL